MKRVFTAIDIPENARLRVARHVRSLRGGFGHIRVGWETSKKLHLTLSFFGNVSADELKALTGATRSAAGELESFKLVIGGCGVFRQRRKPKVLWLGIRDDSGGLKRLWKASENQLQKAGFARKKRAFNPHLTIARLREPGRSAGLVEEHLKKEFEPVEFEVNSLSVYESILSPAGSQFIVLDRFRISTLR